MLLSGLALGAVAAPGRAVVMKDNLYGVVSVGATEAWAVGAFGSIYHTGDGGRTWTSRESGTRRPLFDIDFADARHGWVVGKAALILGTVDGGRTWARQKSPIPPGKHLFNVEVVDARTAWAVGDWGAIVATHDGGATWEDRSLDEDVILYDVAFPDAQHGFIAGEFGTLLATADGGRTWEKRPVGTEKTLFGVSFPTPERGWVVGIDGIILHTPDGGHSWQVQRGTTSMEALEDVGFLETLKNPGLYEIEMVGPYGVVVGDTGTLLTTADGGVTWTRRELPGGDRLVWMRAVSLAGEQRGFAVGARGFAAAIDGERIVVRDGAAAAASAP